MSNSSTSSSSNSSTMGNININSTSTAKEQAKADSADVDDNTTIAATNVKTVGNDLWLMGAISSSNGSNGNSNGNSNSNSNPQVILVPSIDKRDEYILSSASVLSSTSTSASGSTSAFENGYTVRKISNLEELRDGLNALLPPPSSSSSSSSSTTLPPLPPPPFPPPSSFPGLPTIQQALRQTSASAVSSSSTTSIVRVHRKPLNQDQHFQNSDRSSTISMGLGGVDHENQNHERTQLQLQSQLQSQLQRQHNNNNQEEEEEQYIAELQGLDEIKRFELFRSVIQHEDDLLNQRVSWIILAQSFLMAAYITSSGPNSLRYVTAIVGLMTVVVTMPAIIAAGRNIEIQQEVYFKVLESDERCEELHGHGRDVTKKDQRERMNRHLYGHMLPTMAFRGKGSVRILTTVVVLAIVQSLGWIFLLFALFFDFGF